MALSSNTLHFTLHIFFLQIIYKIIYSNIPVLDAETVLRDLFDFINFVTNKPIYEIAFLMRRWPEVSVRFSLLSHILMERVINIVLAAAFTRTNQFLDFSLHT